MVGLIPLFAVEVLNREDLDPHPEFLANVEWFIRNRPDVIGHACYSLNGARYVMSIADPQQLRRILDRLCRRDGVSVSLRHSQPLQISRAASLLFGGKCVGYEPGESDEKIKGGNSNWRGPVWFPTSYLLIRTLMKFGREFGADLAPGRNGQPVVPITLAGEIANRMISIFKQGKDGRRPCFGVYDKFQTDSYWKDCLLFNEYYHGETGQGLGASHQTGWTGLVANLIDEWRR